MVTSIYKHFIFTANKENMPTEQGVYNLKS